ncbi:hypothetical protein [Lacticaseibacillus saniviri]
MSLQKVRSFTKFYLHQTFLNRINLVFTLLFPIIWTLYQGLSHRSQSFSPERLITAIIPLVAYIIAATALDGVTLATIATRDDGFLKSYFFVSGSRWPMFSANVLVQTALVVLENIIYTLFSMALYQVFSLRLLLAVILLTIVAFPLISLFFNWILLLPFQQNSLSALGTSLLIGLLMLYGIDSSNPLLSMLIALNPYQFIANTLRILLGDISLQRSAVELVIIAIYAIIGVISYQHFNLQNRGRA